MKFKHLNCPVCGRQLVNLEEGHEERGLFRYWCDVCNIDVTIDVNKTFACDDGEEEEEDNIPWNEWLS